FALSKSEVGDNRCGELATNPWIQLRINGRCTNKLILFPTHLNDSFDSAILWTDHEKHPLMLWVSFKESGIILLIYALLDPCITTFAIINFFMDKSGYSLSAI